MKCKADAGFFARIRGMPARGPDVFDSLCHSFVSFRYLWLIVSLSGYSELVEPSVFLFCLRVRCSCIGPWDMHVASYHWSTQDLSS